MCIYSVRRDVFVFISIVVCTKVHKVRLNTYKRFELARIEANLLLFVEYFSESSGLFEGGGWSMALITYCTA